MIRAPMPPRKTGLKATTIKGLSYEQKLSVMKILPVTSPMTKAQLSQYAEEVRKDFDRRGVQLEFPQDARWAA